MTSRIRSRTVKRAGGVIGVLGSQRRSTACRAPTAHQTASQRIRCLLRHPIQRAGHCLSFSEGCGAVIAEDTLWDSSGPFASRRPEVPASSKAAF